MEETSVGWDTKRDPITGGAIEATGVGSSTKSGIPTTYTENI